MDWTEIIITVESNDAEKAEAIAHMTVPYGIYIEDYTNLEDEVLEVANIDIIDEELLKKNRTKTLIHLYVSPENNPMEAIAFLEERYKSENISFEITKSNCIIEDWINNWKKYFKPINIGNNLLIRPIWENSFNGDGKTVINLEPGLAFGTGSHETTKLCLEILEKYVKKGVDVLDVGCGSGILSVASLLLGAKSALGIDIDEMSVKTARENAKLNSVDSKFKSICGDLTDRVSGKYDIIIANIVADIVIKLTENIDNFMKQDTIYIMSGIIASRESDVKNILQNKFTIIEEKVDKDWIALVAKLK